MLFKPISSVLIFTSTFHCILFISHETRTIDNDMLTISTNLVVLLATSGALKLI